jgi:hypothetical protein
MSALSIGVFSDSPECRVQGAVARIDLAVAIRLTPRRALWVPLTRTQRDTASLESKETPAENSLGAVNPANARLPVNSTSRSNPSRRSISTHSAWVR